jgi:hypothetical protein
LRWLNDGPVPTPGLREYKAQCVVVGGGSVIVVSALKGDARTYHQVQRMNIIGYLWYLIFGKR